jgi:hypothetical protein
MIKPAFFAALAVFGLAAPALAQDPEWGSEQNKEWWNGITEAELREIVAEAGGTWTDEADRDGVRLSRVDWPDLANVMIQESNCPQPEEPMPERNCGTLELAVIVGIRTGVKDPQGIEWAQGQNSWLTYSESWGVPRLRRLEHHLFGTTRGHVISDLMLFRLFATQEIARLEALVGES